MKLNVHDHVIELHINFKLRKIVIICYYLRLILLILNQFKSSNSAIKGSLTKPGVHHRVVKKYAKFH